MKRAASIVMGRGGDGGWVGPSMQAGLRRATWLWILELRWMFADITMWCGAGRRAAPLLTAHLQVRSVPEHAGLGRFMKRAVRGTDIIHTHSNELMMR